MMSRFRTRHFMLSSLALVTCVACAPLGSVTKEGETTVPGHKTDYPTLPEGVASFGAAVAGDWLYVYGGHVGRAHQHSRDNLARGFLRLDLEGGAAWESLEKGPPLQGLALVAHGDQVYRVGGMSARNAKDEDPDLHSTAEFARYDPVRKSWTALAPLPEPRSSHDAVVLGDRIYVVGGWSLGGGDSDAGSTRWLDTAYSADLTEDPIVWREIPAPPFRRRALSVAATRGRIYALGGIKERGGVSMEVDVLDLSSGKWSPGPPLPMQSGMKGFGVSSFGVGDVLYASGADGILYRLAPGFASWANTGFRLDPGRFFHRLVPHGNRRLLFIGGASELGHLDDVESIEIAGLASGGASN